MKTSFRFAVASLLLAAMALLPATAQTVSPTLTFTGNVQICSSAAAGATCTPATPGQPLAPGSHLMVGPEATAQLTYANGAIVTFSEPGLYTVNAAAGVAGTVSAASVIAANAGYITFAALIAAAGTAASVADEDENLLVPFSQ